MFSGPGRSRTRDTDRIIDGSPLVAYKAAARANGRRLSELHLNDLDSARNQVDTPIMPLVRGQPSRMHGAHLHDDGRAGVRRWLV